MTDGSYKISKYHFDEFLLLSYEKRKENNNLELRHRSYSDVSDAKDG